MINVWGEGYLTGLKSYAIYACIRTSLGIWLMWIIFILNLKSKEEYKAEILNLLSTPNTIYKVSLLWLLSCRYLKFKVDLLQGH